MIKNSVGLFFGIAGLALVVGLSFNNCAKMEPEVTEQQSLDGGGAGGGGTGGGGAVGLNWFNTKVRPVFQSNCTGCHTNIVNGGTTIFDYTTMRALLFGGTSTTNSLIRKTSGQIAHGTTAMPAGNRCTAITLTPCKEISDWWTAEFGAGGGGNGGGGGGGTTPIVVSNIANGDIRQVTTYGKIIGGAARLGNLAETVTMSVYLDGPMGTGTLAATGIQANLLNLDSSSPYYGSHRYEIQLPDTALNGRLHNLYVYATSSTGTILISPAMPIVAYRRVAQATFNSFTINCTGCHGAWKANQNNSTIAEYSAAFETLGRPLKADGGTATTNTFFLKASGGLNHAGGNICGSIQGGCASISNWWTQEFGNAAYPSTRVP